MSFNGQFTSYVHPVQGFEPHHIIDRAPIKTYADQAKSFEKTKKRYYARDIMSSPVHFVHTTSKVSEAIAEMKKFGFRHLPVMDTKEILTGLISDRELIGAEHNSLCESIMVPKIIVALQTARIQEIAHIMLQEKINALPIINGHHVLVGIITQSDILKFVMGSDEFKGMA